MLRIFFYCIILIFISLQPLNAQEFEGWIKYKTEAKNPHPEKVSNAAWMQGIKKQFGEKGYILQKYFYKEGNYLSEIETDDQKGYQLFSESDKYIYSWQEGSSNASKVNSKKYGDKIVDVVYREEIEEIIGIPCKSIYLKTKEGGMTLWYNDEYFKMDHKLFKGHDYGLWNKILKNINCLPLKIETKGMMIHLVQTAISYKEETLDCEIFKIPTFENVIENPSN